MATIAPIGGASAPGVPQRTESLPAAPQLAPFRLDGAIFQLLTNPSGVQETVATRLTTALTEVREIQRRIGIIQGRFAELDDVEATIRQDIDILTRVRDQQLVPTLSSLTTNPTEAQFDLRRDAIDSLLDTLIAIDSPLLRDPSGVRQALEDARGIIDGTRGTIGNSRFYNYFLAGVDPSTLAGRIFDFDANEPGGVVDNEPDGRADQFVDLTGNGNTGTANGGPEPTIVAGALNGLDVLRFDGVDDRFDIGNDAQINTAGPYAARTFSIVLTGGPDVTTRQVVFEEGAGTRGINITIDGGQLYFTVYNFAEEAYGPVSISTPIAPGQTIAAQFEFTGGVGLTGSLQGVVNGTPIAPVGGVGLLYAHGGDVNIGDGFDTVYFDGTSNDGIRFAGDLAEFVAFDRVLTATEKADVDQFLRNRYGLTGGGASQAQLDIAAARSTLTESIATLEAELGAVADLRASSEDEIERLTRELQAALVGLTDRRSGDIFPQTLQLANPQAFGVIDPGTLSDVFA